MIGICGHQYTGEQTISTLCPDCEAKLYGETLPPLFGNKREVAAAATIQAGFLRNIAKTIIDEHQDLHRTMQISALVSKQKSRWWIEHRNYGIDEIMFALM